MLKASIANCVAGNKQTEKATACGFQYDQGIATTQYHAQAWEKIIRSSAYKKLICCDSHMGDFGCACLRLTCFAMIAKLASTT